MPRAEPPASRPLRSSRSLTGRENPCYVPGEEPILEQHRVRAVEMLQQRVFTWLVAVAGFVVVGAGYASAFLGLFFFLTSAAATYSPDELAVWLAEAGFEKPRRVRIRRIPGQTLYEARKRG
jgi:hypothetical protein